MNKAILFLLIGITQPAKVPPVADTYFLGAHYSVIITGKSNLRDWQETVEKVTGTVVANLNEDGSVDLLSILIIMDVHSIKSDMGSIMNNKTYEALKASSYPQILFSLIGPVKLLQFNPRAQTVAIEGRLTLAGVCRQVTMLVHSFSLYKGKLQFEGSESINMTDFGVKPPSALFGTMRSGPEIIIHFNTNFLNKQELP
jgi:polyisoprenoid-binding protein YceI